MRILLRADIKISWQQASPAHRYGGRSNYDDKYVSMGDDGGDDVAAVSMGDDAETRHRSGPHSA